MELIQNFVSAHNVLISAGILILAYIFIAMEKIPKVTIALLGAGITIVLGLVSQIKTVGGVLNPHYFVNFIDFNVIFLLVSMMIIVNITTRSGVFTYLANELMKATNVTTVILILPITFAIARKLVIDPIPFLLTEVFASNIGGTATLIGDPPNIIIGSAAGFSFMDFINNLTGVISIILFTVIVFLSIMFKSKLHADETKMKEIAEIDNSKTITDKNLMIRSMLVLGLVILGFVTHDITHIETCVAAMLGASVLLLFEKPTDILKDVEWNTIFFFIGLFIIIGGVEASGGIKLMAEWILKVTQGSQEATSMLILWGSGLISGIIDNIPYTATMSPMLVEIQRTMGEVYTTPLWWSLSLGACLGGNLTIIGAAANVIVSENAAKEGHPIAFLRFMKYGVAVVILSLLISTVYLNLRFI